MKMKNIKVFERIIDNTILSDNQINIIQKKILDDKSISALLVEAVDTYKKNLKEHLKEKVNDSDIKL